MTTATLLTHRLEEPPSSSSASASSSPSAPSTVLLLNGGMMTFASWEPIVERLLAAGFRVLRCDLRGQLLSPGVPPDSLDGHADDLVALLDSVEGGEEASSLERVHVVGVSFGALVGVRLALLHPQRVRSLVVITAAARATEAMDESTRSFRQLLDAVLAADEATLEEQRARLAVQDRLEEEVFSPAWRREHSALLALRRERVGDLPRSWYEGLQGLIDTLEGYDLEARRPGSDRRPLPSRALLAGDDLVMPEAGARALAEALGASIAVRPAAGHALVLEDGEWVADELLTFLASARDDRGAVA